MKPIKFLLILSTILLFLFSSIGSCSKQTCPTSKDLLYLDFGTASYEKDGTSIEKIVLKSTTKNFDFNNLSNVKAYYQLYRESNSKNNNNIIKKSTTSDIYTVPIFYEKNNYFFKVPTYNRATYRFFITADCKNHKYLTQLTNFSGYWKNKPIKLTGTMVSNPFATYNQLEVSNNRRFETCELISLNYKVNSSKTTSRPLTINVLEANKLIDSIQLNNNFAKFTPSEDPELNWDRHLTKRLTFSVLDKETTNTYHTTSTIYLERCSTNEKTHNVFDSVILFIIISVITALAFIYAKRKKNYL